MSDVPENLKQLVARRLIEMGERRNRGPLTLHEAYLGLPQDERGKAVISYEIVRKIANGEHRNIGDRVADAIALMLDVNTSEVLVAAGQRPRLGKFVLPRKADRLDENERRAVLQMIDTLLEAGERRRTPVREQLDRMVRTQRDREDKAERSVMLHLTNPNGQVDN